MLAPVAIAPADLVNDPLDHAYEVVLDAMIAPPAPLIDFPAAPVLDLPAEAEFPMPPPPVEGLEVDMAVARVEHEYQLALAAGMSLFNPRT